MSKRDEILPQEHLLLMDLVEEAGVDVSSWADGKGGAAGATTNPKYCYEWSFVETNKVVVLNLWHDQMEESPAGLVSRPINMRERIPSLKEPAKTRAVNFDQAIQAAIKGELPIRVIVGSGRRRDPNDPTSKASKVSKRLLDPVAWSVAAYNWETGQCTLARGGGFCLTDDQNLGMFPDVDPEVYSVSEGRKQWVWHLRRERNPGLVKKKKRSVVSRTGKLLCEVCDFDFGKFYHPNAANFCEVHHRKPLGKLKEGTPTRLDDLAIICSNCHRAIHLINPMPSVEQLRAQLRFQIELKARS